MGGAKVEGHTRQDWGTEAVGFGDGVPPVEKFGEACP